MRLIAFMGAESERARKVESKKLLNYGFRFSETITRTKLAIASLSNVFGWVTKKMYLWAF